MARAMAKAGVSITITSFTDAIAFVLGTTSQLPALSAFCGFAAVGIAADFLLQARPTMATYYGAIHYGATYYGATYLWSYLLYYGASCIRTRTVHGIWACGGPLPQRKQRTSSRYSIDCPAYAHAHGHAHAHAHAHALIARTSRMADLLPLTRSPAPHVSLPSMRLP